ncbi:protoporphyrinogen oxidase [Brockia lithotrophica]|uniref:Coproporphyrinogen III oxidase n=1 Tax=Brockia lithotrophica TaxID=933949 RepID=A0A660KVA1_9BACL|nr:protoporphyrinogen oxidase [Brockia lithotrophica]RKQ83878.1 oxygen-dependent protoporphyrinogen oxidase [Brockia lithotrophica]
MRVAVLGGGVSGLAAAYYLLRNRDRAPDLRVDVYERAPRLGGVVETYVADGAIIERGPDAFFAKGDAIFAVLRELGLEDDLVVQNPEAGPTYVCRRGRLLPLPPGTEMGVPRRLIPLIRTPLLSPAGKLRAALDLVLPPLQAPGDVSVGEFFRRRFGEEVVEALIEPLVGTVYGAEADILSLDTLFPTYRELERRYRSVLLGLRRSARTSPQGRPRPAGQAPGAGKFVTLRSGLEELVRRLARELPSDAVHLRTGVDALTWEDGLWKLTLSTGKTVSASVVVSTLPAWELARLLRGMGREDGAALLEEIPYSSTANIAFRFAASPIPGFPGAAILVPPRERRVVSSVSFTSRKWPHTVPPGESLVRVFVDRRSVERYSTDAEIREAVEEDLVRLFGNPLPPVRFALVSRFERSLALYTVGHKERLARIRAYFANFGLPLVVRGAVFTGVGIPDCLTGGERAAEEVLEYLTVSARRP